MADGLFDVLLAYAMIFSAGVGTLLIHTLLGALFIIIAMPVAVLLTGMWTWSKSNSIGVFLGGLVLSLLVVVSMGIALGALCMGIQN